LEANASLRSEQWRDEEAGKIRDAIAGFIHAPVQNVAMVPNFSFGMNCLVQSLDGNEKILLFKQDYPSLTIPFLINGFDITWIDAADGFTIDIEEINRLIISNGIDLLAISHVQWQSGFKIDLEALGDCCRKHNVSLIIDGTQSLGAIPVDLSMLQIDAFLASNYKWMNAGFGTGIMYVSGPFLKKYPPVTGGPASYVLQEGISIYEPSIRSYEPGHLNMAGLSMLAAAIREKSTMGMEYILVHNGNLTTLLLEGLQDLPVTLIGPPAYTKDRCSIVFLKDEKGLGNWLKQHGIITTIRNGNIRISMHYYNTETDINALLKCIRQWPGLMD
jgi:selenocysteine lyase/cysteine desulfurase